VEVGCGDGTAALLAAAATCSSTGSEGGPGRETAVHGAVESLASLHELGDRASDTAVKVHVDDGASAELGTAATSSRASSEGGPAGDLAVNGASEGVASEGVRQSRASETAVLDIGDDGASLGLAASAAGLGASAVTGPVRGLAVDGASERVTGLVLLEHGASDTTVEVGV